MQSIFHARNEQCHATSPHFIERGRFDFTHFTRLLQGLTLPIALQTAYFPTAPSAPFRRASPTTAHHEILSKQLLTVADASRAGADLEQYLSRRRAVLYFRIESREISRVHHTLILLAECRMPPIDASAKSTMRLSDERQGESLPCHMPFPRVVKFTFLTSVST